MEMQASTRTVKHAAEALHSETEELAQAVHADEYGHWASNICGGQPKPSNWSRLQSIKKLMLNTDELIQAFQSSLHIR
jgi:hypothetical protein